VDTNDGAIGGSFRASTVWRTYFEKYYLSTGDPRVQWDSSLTQRLGEFQGILWDRQQKYTSYASSQNLLTGREMRLIRAEVALRNNDIPTAMGLINGIRTSVVSKGGTAVAAGATLPPWPVPGSIQEAWMDLFHERRIELWLEGRSMGDDRRWIADGTWGTNIIPGTYGLTTGATADSVSRAGEDASDRLRLCVPITRGERQTNSHLAPALDDPTSPIYTGPGAPW
jgi:hypothetical protein